MAFHTTSWFTPTRNFNAEDVVFSLNRIIGYVEELPALDFTEGEEQRSSKINIMPINLKRI
ncbi:peptide ABC transporter substrate-binding protein [Actinobacillus equuli]|nr:peptide ABC transporter substrate-binding protein [Actinobacillus equuli]